MSLTKCALVDPAEALRSIPCLASISAPEMANRSSNEHVIVFIEGIAQELVREVDRIGYYVTQ